MCVFDKSVGNARDKVTLEGATAHTCVESRSRSNTTGYIEMMQNCWLFPQCGAGVWGRSLGLVHQGLTSPRPRPSTQPPASSLLPDLNTLALKSNIYCEKLIYMITNVWNFRGSKETVNLSVM